jgi:hypothetical protein
MIMETIYQPIVIERTNEIIETLIETNFFDDYEIKVTDFARNHISDNLTEKFINGDTDLSDDEIFTEEEFEKISRVVDGLVAQFKKLRISVKYDNRTNQKPMIY